MKRMLLVLVVAAGAVAAGCSGDTVVGPGEEDVEIPAPDILAAAPTGGSCPDVYHECSADLGHGMSVTWTCAFGGFDYRQGDPYDATVTWNVDGGSAEFVECGPRSHHRHTWTPVGQDPVSGTFQAGQPGMGEVPVTVTMSPMHRSIEDMDGDGHADWMGYIGNGHFWLVLDLEAPDGHMVHAKLGVNVHLEDPDDGFDPRCP